MSGRRRRGLQNEQGQFSCADERSGDEWGAFGGAGGRPSSGSDEDSFERLQAGLLNSKACEAICRVGGVSNILLHASDIADAQATADATERHRRVVEKVHKFFPLYSAYWGIAAPPKKIDRKAPMPGSRANSHPEKGFDPLHRVTVATIFDGAASQFGALEAISQAATDAVLPDSALWNIKRKADKPKWVLPHSSAYTNFIYGKVDHSLQRAPQRAKPQGVEHKRRASTKQPSAQACAARSEQLALLPAEGRRRKWQHTDVDARVCAVGARIRAVVPQQFGESWDRLHKSHLKSVNAYKQKNSDGTTTVVEPNFSGDPPTGLAAYDAYFRPCAAYFRDRVLDAIDYPRNPLANLKSGNGVKDAFFGGLRAWAERNGYAWLFTKRELDVLELDVLELDVIKLDDLGGGGGGGGSGPQPSSSSLSSDDGSSAASLSIITRESLLKLHKWGGKAVKALLAFETSMVGTKSWDAADAAGKRRICKKMADSTGIPGVGPAKMEALLASKLVFRAASGSAAPSSSRSPAPRPPPQPASCAAVPRSPSPPAVFAQQQPRHPSVLGKSRRSKKRAKKKSMKSQGRLSTAKRSKKEEKASV